MGEPPQSQPHSRTLPTPSRFPPDAAVATSPASTTAAALAFEPRRSQTLAITDASFDPSAPYRVPSRPLKICKISPSNDAPPDAAAQDGKSLQSVDDSSRKPARVYKDQGRNRKRTASLAPRAMLRILKPLSSQGEILLALRHLRNSDPLLAPLVDAYQPPKFESFDPPFLALTKSIVFQQLAHKAGTAIYARFLSLCGGESAVLPETVLALSSNQLRQMGISGRKATYLYDLANKYRNGILSDASILEMDDRSLSTMLTMVKGIGSWSVHMFMIFSLHRPDVLPVHDHSIRKGVQLLYGLEELPRPSQMEQLCDRWRPYRSVGSWYMWRLFEDKGTQTATAQATLVDNVQQEQQKQQLQHEQQQQVLLHEQQQHQHQLQLLDSINSIANFGACIWGQ